MTDVLIVVENREFKTHKAVLACYSPYFAEVLVRPGFNDVHYLQLPGVSARAFAILLEYMYTGRLQVSCQELNEVYRSARKLEMTEALRKCVELLQVDTNHFQNVVYLYVASRKLGISDASERAFKLMREHFERLVTTEEFVDLEPDQVIDLLSSDVIGARSEIIIFLAALKWLNHSYIEREENIVPVLNCVRFPLMDMAEVLACYHPPVIPGIVNIPAIRAKLLNATCFIAAKSLKQEHLFLYLAAQPREFLYAGEPVALWDVSIFDPDKYQEIKRISAATRITAIVKGFLTRKHLKKNLYVANCAATVIQSAFRGFYTRKALQLRKDIIEGKVSSPKDLKFFNSPLPSNAIEAIVDAEERKLPIFFILGAFDTKMGSEGQNVVFKFNCDDMKFEYVSKCPVPLHDSRMVSTSKALYILGGYSPLHWSVSAEMRNLKDCYKYQFADGEWTHLPAMNHGRSLHGAAELDGMILAIGGRDERNNILSSIEQYNPLTNCWEEVVQLPEPRMGMGVACDGSRLWIAGGISSNGGHVNLLDSVWCYKKNEASWIKQAILPTPLAFPAILHTGSRVMLIGGAIRTNREDKSQLESVEIVLSLDGDEWSKKVNMPVQCHNVVAGNSGENLYVFGGFRTQTMSQLTGAIFFDSNIEKWEHLCDLPEDAAGFMVALSKS